MLFPNFFFLYGYGLTYEVRKYFYLFFIFYFFIFSQVTMQIQTKQNIQCYNIDVSLEEGKIYSTQY